MKINLENLENSVMSMDSEGKYVASATKYHTISELLNVFIEYFYEKEDEDIETVSYKDRNIEDAPISVKLAYNTLLHYGIIQ